MMYAQSAHAQPGHEGPSDDAWFVAFGPDDVRTLSLEQLDDAYRLDVINDETLVCSTSMNTWVPLGIVAGVKADATAPATVNSRGAVNPFHDVVLLSKPEPQPRTKSRSRPMPSSVAPATLDVTPYPYPTGGSRWTGFLVFAALCGGLVVAYRAGLVSQLAGSIGMKRQYTALASRALGAMGVNALALDTAEGTQAFLDRLQREYRLDELKTLGQRYGASASNAPSDHSHKSSDLAAASAVKSLEPAQTQAAAVAPATVSDEAKPAEGEPAPAPIDIDSLPRAEAEVAPAPLPVMANTRTQSQPTREVAAPVVRPVSQNLDTQALRDVLARSKAKSKRGKRDKAAEFDPLYGGIP